MRSVEEIVFTKTLSIWKSKFDTSNIQELVSECEEIIEGLPDVKNDGYPFYINKGLKYDGELKIEVEKKLGPVLIEAIKSCIELYDSVINEIKMDCWINVVRAKDPIQKNFKQNGGLIFHNHVDINIKNKFPIPLYTFVCYIQMPDNLSEDDGVLFLRDTDGSIFSILPKEGDILIMKGDLSHVPNFAPNSSKDRIVLAGNIRMDFLKFDKTLM